MEVCPLEFGEIIQVLESLSSSEDIQGMARFGINPQKLYGVRMPELRKIAKKVGKDHDLADELWEYGYRETQILACMIEDPVMVSSKQMDRWVVDFDYWEICDQCCVNLFRKTSYAYDKIVEWSLREEEFVKRSAFALIAVMAVHDKEAPDAKFEQFFPIIIKESSDDRKYVKKAVNWALRHIGKRNIRLNLKAIEVAEKIQKIDSKSARWIANDALRELKSDKVQNRLGKICT